LTVQQGSSYQSSNWLCSSRTPSASLALAFNTFEGHMNSSTQQRKLLVDDTVKQLLDQAQGAIHASNASQALQVPCQAKLELSVA
jgi:hypothetical protein